MTTPTRTPRPVGVQVIGFHPDQPNRLLVELTLDLQPTLRWSELLAACREPGDPTGFSLELDGALVRLAPPDTELEAWLAVAERRIRLANARYIAEKRSSTGPMQAVRPRMSQAIHLEQFSPETRSRILEARRTASRVADVFQSSLWKAEDDGKPGGEPPKSETN